MPSIIATLLTNWKIVAIALTTGTVFLGGWYCGDSVVRDEWNGDKLRQQAALVQAQNKVIEKERDASKTTQEITHAYEDKIAAINANHDAVVGRLQQARAGSMPQISCAAERADDTSCKLEKAKLTALQEWVRAQVMVYNK